MDLFTEPGTLDLTQRLPADPAVSRELAEQRAWCDELGHVPITYNPVHDLTYCSCGLVTYPGDHGEAPLPRVATPCGAPVTDPAWSYGHRGPVIIRFSGRGDDTRYTVLCPLGHLVTAGAATGDFTGSAIAARISAHTSGRQLWTVRCDGAPTRR